MKIKLDENLSRHLKDPLSEQGHDASTAHEEALLGKVDIEVGAAAKGEDRMSSPLISTSRILENFRPDHIPELSCLGLAAWDQWRLTNSC